MMMVAIRGLCKKNLGSVFKKEKILFPEFIIFTHLFRFMNMDRFTLYSWHFLSKQTIVDPKYNYKKILKRNGAFILFPQGKGKNKAKIVKDRKSKKSADLEAAEKELKELMEYTLCAKVPFPNEKIYDNFCKHYQNDISSFLETNPHSNLIKSTIFFPKEEFESIKEYYKSDSSFQLKENTGLVIFLFHKRPNFDENVKKKVENDLQIALINHQGKSQGLKEKKNLSSQVFLIQQQQPNQQQQQLNQPPQQNQPQPEKKSNFEINLSDFYLYSKREILKKIIEAHYNKFFSEKRIYSHFREKPLNLLTKGDESKTQVLSLEASSVVFNSLNDWIRLVIQGVKTTEDFIDLDKSLAVFKEAKDREFLKAYLLENFVPKENLKPPSFVFLENFEQKGLNLQMKIFLVVSEFHLKERNLPQSDLLVQQMYDSIKGSIQSLISTPLKSNKEVEFVRNKFKKCLYKIGENSYHILGDKNQVQEIIDYLKRVEEQEIVVSEFFLKDQSQKFILKHSEQGAFREFEKRGLDLKIMNIKIVFTGAKKVVSDFTKFLDDYFEKKKKEIFLWNKKIVNPDEREFIIKKNESLKSKAEKHKG